MAPTTSKGKKSFLIPLLILIVVIIIIVVVISGGSNSPAKVYYACNNGECSSSTTEAQYTSLSDCQKNCSTKSEGYECIGGQCQSSKESTQTLAQCQSQCSSSNVYYQCNVSTKSCERSTTPTNYTSPKNCGCDKSQFATVNITNNACFCSTSGCNNQNTPTVQSPGDVFFNSDGNPITQSCPCGSNEGCLSLAYIISSSNESGGTFNTIPYGQTITVYVGPTDSLLIVGWGILACSASSSMSKGQFANTSTYFAGYSYGDVENGANLIFTSDTGNWSSCPTGNPTFNNKGQLYIQSTTTPPNGSITPGSGYIPFVAITNPY